MFPQFQVQKAQQRLRRQQCTWCDNVTDVLARKQKRQRPTCGWAQKGRNISIKRRIQRPFFLLFLPQHDFFDPCVMFFSHLCFLFFFCGLLLLVVSCWEEPCGHHMKHVTCSWSKLELGGWNCQHDSEKRQPDILDHHDVWSTIIATILETCAFAWHLTGGRARSFCLKDPSDTKTRNNNETQNERQCLHPHETQTQKPARPYTASAQEFLFFNLWQTTAWFSLFPAGFTPVRFYMNNIVDALLSLVSCKKPEFPRQGEQAHKADCVHLDMTKPHISDGQTWLLVTSRLSGVPCLEGTVWSALLDHQLPQGWVEFPAWKVVCKSHCLIFITSYLKAKWSSLPGKYCVKHMVPLRASQGTFSWHPRQSGIGFSYQCQCFEDLHMFMLDFDFPHWMLPTTMDPRQKRDQRDKREREFQILWNLVSSALKN